MFDDTVYPWYLFIRMVDLFILSVRLRAKTIAPIVLIFSHKK